MREDEEFYIGYSPEAPKGIARAVKSAAGGLILVVILLAILLVSGQGEFAASFFDYGNVVEFEGVVREKPYPVLLTQTKSHSLVAEGKRGAGALVAGLDGRSVKLRGTLIHRDDRTMIEVVEGSVVPQQLSEISTPAQELGVHALVGEIVDSKCYLGVMNPGHTKPHRECASLCIRGGIPPLFVVRDSAGNRANLWLVTEQGEPANQEVLDFIAEPVEIAGAVTKRGEELFLKILEIRRK